MTTRWRPLLEGGQADDARATVEAVAEALKDPPPASLELDEFVEEQRDIDEISLGRGRAGYSLLFDYLDATSLASVFMDEAVDKVAEIDLSPSLYMGFPGIAWALQVVQGNDSSDDDPNEQIDDVLVAFVARSPWRADYDLISGLVGIAVYALERLPRPLARDCLEAVVARLGELAEHKRGGITWFTRPELLPPQQRREHPRGYYNLGVAHGVPGIVAVLGACYAAGVATETAASLLEGAVEWLLSARLPQDSPSRFPTVTSPGARQDPARAAWCYGDPGIAAALLVAARGSGREDWEKEAIDIGLAAANRPDHTTGVRDPGICHGSAGLAHLFNRLYQATDLDEFCKAGVHWFENTLRFRHEGRGVGGFETWSPDHNAMTPHPGFLQGSAGIALALAAAVTSHEPEWDRVLLASAKPNLP